MAALLMHIFGFHVRYDKQKLEFFFVHATRRDVYNSNSVSLFLHNCGS